MSAAAPDPWPRRLMAMLIALFAVSVLVSWVSVSYLGRNPAAVESFTPADGWCDPATDGIGVHCFGDFQLPRAFLGEDSPWDPVYPAPGAVPAPNPYTATAMAPHLFARAIEWVGAGHQGSMVAYLILLAAALLAPALWATLGRPRPRDWVPLLLIGVASGPFLTTMDRGNSAGFAVPFILLFGLYVRRRPDWVAPVALVCAALIRPQFIFLALALLAFGRIRSTLAAVGAWFVISASAFALLPGGPISNISAWWSSLTAFDAQLDRLSVPLVASREFINLSVAHTVTMFDDWLVGAPGFVGTYGPMATDWIVGHTMVPGVVLALLALVTVLLAPSRRVLPMALVVALIVPILTQALSFGYYLMVALPLAALILGPSADALDGTGTSRERSGMLRSLSRSSRVMTAWAWGLLATIGLSVVPFIYSTDIGRQSTVKGYVGALWLLVVLVTLVLMWMPPRILGVAQADDVTGAGR